MNPVIMLDEVDKMGAAIMAIQLRPCSKCSILNKIKIFSTTISMCAAIFPMFSSSSQPTFSIRSQNLLKTAWISCAFWIHLGRKGENCTEISHSTQPQKHGIEVVRRVVFHRAVASYHQWICPRSRCAQSGKLH